MAIVIYPVLVQGKGAAPSIVKAIESLNAMGEADVLIVGRGGGSLEELWAFNEEEVARAIAASRITVISAVGHGPTSRSPISRLISARLRRLQPQSWQCRMQAKLAAQLRQQQQRLRQGLLRRSQRGSERLASLQRSLALVGPRRYLLQHTQRLDMLRERLRRAADMRLRRGRERQAVLQHSLARFNPRDAAVSARQRMESMRRELMSAMQARQLRTSVPAMWRSYGIWMH